MSPCKIWHARVPNLTIRKIKIKLTVIPEPAVIKAFPELQCQDFSKFLQLSFAIFSSCFALLFLFNNTLSVEIIQALTAA